METTELDSDTEHSSITMRPLPAMKACRREKWRQCIPRT